MVIRNISLDHAGGFYFYRLHDLKIDKLCKNFPSLKNYFDEMFKNCPNSYFNSGPRSSALTFKLKNSNLIQIQGHEISALVKVALKENKERFSNGHSKVQVFLLENDDKTIANEIPIWMKENELADFKKLFKTTEPLTGHIDLLRIDNKKIWIWDYKPYAQQERFAATQVYFYALMLAKRTELDLKNFRCGYFDQNYAFMFKPEECKVGKSLSLFRFL